MNPTIVIPSYWAGGPAELKSPGAYDHSSDLSASRPELDRCLASLEQVRHLPRVIVLLVCPQQETERIAHRVRDIIDMFFVRHLCLEVLNGGETMKFFNKNINKVLSVVLVVV